MASEGAPVLVVVGRPRSVGPWWPYLTEVFDHFRIATRVVDADESAEIADCALVICIAPVGCEVTQWQGVREWVNAGGTAMIFGDPQSVIGEPGITLGEPVSPQQVQWSNEALWSCGGHVVDCSLGGAETVAWWGAYESPAVVQVPYGAGRMSVWGVDVWETLVRVQQGEPVLRKREPSPDGSVPVTDNVLRADDGCILPYDLRVQPTSVVVEEPFTHTWPARPGAPIYGRAICDRWRARLLAAVYDASRDKPLTWLHYWPAGVEAIGHVSHDSDLNRDSDALEALAAFSRAGVNVTWCHCHPGGYSDEVIERISVAGHEHALHYNAMEDTAGDVWGRSELIDQLAWARDITGAGQSLIANKNHYTRWEGWTDFYSWCDESGIQIDQSRGPSKQGNIGFLFGSAHLHRAWDPAAQHFFDVLQLPFQTQDLAYAGHASVAEPIMDEAIHVHGVAHYLFHGTNMTACPDVADAVVEIAELGRLRGLQWWTAAQINAWERARRGVELVTNTRAGYVDVRVTSAKCLMGAGVLIAVPGGDSEPMWVAEDQHGRRLEAHPVVRHGLRWVEVACDIPEGSYGFTLHPLDHGA